MRPALHTARTLLSHDGLCAAVLFVSLLGVDEALRELRFRVGPTMRPAYEATQTCDNDQTTIISDNCLAPSS